MWSSGPQPVESDSDPASGVKTASLLPGMTVTRKMGPVVFIISLSKTTAKVSVTAKLGESQVSGLVMTVADPTVVLKVADGKHEVSGSLGTFFCDAAIDSHLIADFSVTDQAALASRKSVKNERDDLAVYRGDLIQWVSPEPRVLDVFSFFIMSDLEAHAELIDNQNSGSQTSARITFYYGSQVVDSYLVMPTSTVVETRQTSVGNVTIQQGGTIRLRPATSMQRGQIKLDINVESVSPKSSVHYDGVLGEWSWINGRSGNCRE